MATRNRSSPTRSRRLRSLRVGAIERGKGYRVWIGPGALDRLLEDLVREKPGERSASRIHPRARRREAGVGPDATRSASPPRVVVVSDTTVARLYGIGLVRTLTRRGVPAAILSFPHGERHKTRATKARLEDGLAGLRFGRDGVIVALGGGVTGDLAGFLAATWHRGVGLVQAPTSLIGMLDAAIGGKVGVDHPAAKNLIGAFHPPLAVYADTRTLATLPPREFRSGLAEAVKGGAIAEAKLFMMIERDREALLRRDPSATLGIVHRAARLKSRIVERDERESGLRMLLNFGHTLGHALEAHSGYRLRHGEAVAIGMVLESQVAVGMGLLDPEDASRIERLLQGLGLPTRPSRGLNRDTIGGLLAATSRDKKVRGGRTLYVLPSRIGRHAGGCRYSLAVPEPLVRRVLEETLDR